MNHTSAAVAVELVHEVFDASNVRVARSTTPVSIAAAGEAAFESRTEPVADYRTWSPGYGNALPDELHRRDVQIIKDDGFNFLRLAHYPQDPAVLEEADRLGPMIWEEIPVVNLVTMSDAFRENAETWLVKMSRRHYNHPSVFMWGYLNEIMLREPDPVPEGYYEAV